jgi:GAF domain-containing protein
MDAHQELLAEFERVASPGSRIYDVMQLISDRLHASQTRYNWVGFYLLDEADPDYLLLGPHAGVFTPPLRISLNRGLCGAAASAGRMVVVNDVSKDPRYLVGTDATKSEIVVPIAPRGAVVAVLDINSFFKDTWTKEETAFVEQCAALMKRCM